MWSWSSLVISFFALFVIIEKAYKIYKKGLFFTHTSAFYYLVMSFFIALGMLFQAEGVYLAFNVFLDVANLAWLISNSSLVLAIYFCSAGTFLAIGNRPPKPLKYATVTCLLTLLALFPQITRLPNKPTHIFPEILPEYLFMMIFYIYIFVVCAVTFFIYVNIYRYEQVFVAKIRWISNMSVLLMAMVCMCSRMFSTTIAYIIPDSTFIDFLHYITLYSLLLAGIVWVFSYFLQRLYLKHEQYFIKRDKLLNLKSLHNYLVKFHEPIIHLTPNFLIWRKIDFHSSYTVIGILDSKSWIPDDSRIHPTVWENLIAIDDNLPYENIIDMYSDLGRKIRRNELE